MSNARVKTATLDVNAVPGRVTNHNTSVVESQVSTPNKAISSPANGMLESMNHTKSKFALNATDFSGATFAMRGQKGSPPDSSNQEIYSSQMQYGTHKRFGGQKMSMKAQRPINA